MREIRKRFEMIKIALMVLIIALLVVQVGLIMNLTLVSLAGSAVSAVALMSF